MGVVRRRLIYDRDPVVRVARIGASTASVCLVFFGCGVSSEQPLVCGAAPEGIGLWTNVPNPEGEVVEGVSLPLRGEFMSDAQELLFVQQDCVRCQFGALDAESGVWKLVDTQEVTDLHLDGYAAASEQFVASPSSGIAILNRATLEWAEAAKPADWPGREWKGWSGSEFIYWGWSESLSGSIMLTPDSRFLQHYDGALLDPETLEWTMIPPARDAVEYTYGEGGPSLASVWTPDGLFVWGTNPERSARWGAIFDRESMSWSELEVDEELPPLWQNHSMIALGGDVYLYGGGQPGKDERSRRLFRYSLDREQWIEISVPEWADPQEAAIVNDKLVFMGRCTGGSRYDPVTDTWDALAVQGGPPSPGKVLGLGNYLAVTDTEYHPAPTFRVWLLELAK